MKKRNLFVLIALFLIAAIVWVIEPLTLNPFIQVEIPKAKSEIALNCSDSHLTAERDLEREANSIVNAYM